MLARLHSFAAPLALAASLFTAPAWADKPPAGDHPAALPPLPRSAIPPAALPPLKKAAADARPASKSGAPPADLHRWSESFADVAERVSPSVVQINVTAGGGSESASKWLKSERVQHGLGSGVIYTSDGAILTNNHVIEDARAILVRLQDGRMFTARVAGRDPATDLAVLRIDAKNLPAATFADSDAARPGEWVLAIGSPFGLGHTVTSGVLSAKERGGVGINAVEDYLQTDASINPGNSGGPLVDLEGRVLGINTMIVSGGQGIGLAVPARMARRVADQLLKTGRVDRAYIGLGMQDLTPQLAAELHAATAGGALVNAVSANGPAGKAKIDPGDVIVAIDGRPIRSAQDIVRAVFLHSAGDTLAVDLMRDGKAVRAQVKLESRNDPAPPLLPLERRPAADPGLGLTLRQAGSAAVIIGVAGDSAADRAGLKPGDVVLEVDGKHGPTAAEVASAAEDGHLLLRVQRQDTLFYAAVRR